MPDATQHEGTKSDFNPKVDHKVSRPEPEPSLSSCSPSAVKRVTLWGHFQRACLPALCPAQLGAGLEACVATLAPSGRQDGGKGHKGSVQ